MDPKLFYKTITPLYREATRFALESYQGRQPILLLQAGQVLHYLLSRKRKAPDQFCYTKIGKDHFSVSSQGDVYPCQMLNENERYDMGNVRDPKLFTSPEFHGTQTKLDSVNKTQMPCHSCWARNLCFVCMAGVDMEIKSMKAVPKHRCDLIKAVIEEVIVYLADLNAAPERKELFLSQLGRGPARNRDLLE